MKLKLFYHLVPQPHWQDFFNEKLEKIISSKLWDNLNEIVLCIHRDETIFNEIKLKYENDQRIKFISHTDSVSPFEEQYTNRTIKEYCENDNFFLLRIHNKGINHIDHPINGNLAKEYANLLDECNIINWQNAVEKLSHGYDAAGVNWVKNPWPHFIGNVWWTTSDYVKKLPLLMMPHENNFKQQITGGGWTIHDAESWIGTCNPSAWDLFRKTNIIGNHPDIKE